ncbi:uncharacterized protein LOC130625370 isoform X2 [Hydractinia symbiolongicarpus]|uniref:uncharacterized protein LOC130625370 isoform X2 n=1 Tax=Hydractinia symbiolongicarpus TaxID=13093 RepID=UPI00254AFC42|nr:uncharacterized protein LOC130625370 isoform X2 [Hydractinia symbiolongicarpus]
MIPFLLILLFGKSFSMQELFPYGYHEGDARLCKNMERLDLKFSMKLFYHEHEKIYIHQDGIISINKPLSDGIGLLSDKTVLAIYYKPVNRCLGGDIYYREEHKPTLLRRAGITIARNYPERKDIINAVIITYIDMPSAEYPEKINTFQVTLASDRYSTYAIMNYPRLNSNNATVGVSDPFCRWEEFVNPKNSNQLSLTSNINQTGVYVYKLTQRCIQTYGYSFVNNRDYGQLRNSKITFHDVVDGVLKVDLYLYKLSNKYLQDVHFNLSIYVGKNADMHNRYREANEPALLKRATKDVRDYNNNSFVASQGYLMAFRDKRYTLENVWTFQIYIVRGIDDSFYCLFIFTTGRQISITSNFKESKSIHASLPNDWMKNWYFVNKDLQLGSAYAFKKNFNDLTKKLEFYKQNGNEDVSDKQIYYFNSSTLDMRKTYNYFAYENEEVFNRMMGKIYFKVTDNFYIAFYFYIDYDMGDFDRYPLDVSAMHRRNALDKNTREKVREDIQKVSNITFYPEEVLVLTFFLTGEGGFNSKFQLAIARNGETIYVIVQSDSYKHFVHYAMIYKYCKHIGSISAISRNNVFLLTNTTCHPPVIYPYHFSGSTSVHPYSRGMSGGVDRIKFSPAIPFFSSKTSTVWYTQYGTLFDDKSSNVPTKNHQTDFEKFPFQGIVLAVFKGVRWHSFDYGTTEELPLRAQADEDIKKFTNESFKSTQLSFFTFGYGNNEYSQVVLATDKKQLYGIFNFARSSYKEGLVGFGEDFCGWKNYASGWESSQLGRTSNIGVPGRHVMRLSSDNCNKTVLFPYGPNVGDVEMQRGDNYVEVMKLNTSFPGFEKSLYISTNGVVSPMLNTSVEIDYHREMMDYPYVAIAPFHGDFDTSHSGHIYYRESRDPELLRQINESITKSQMVYSPVTHALVISFVDIPNHDSPQERNTFQIVIAHNASQDVYMVFKYTHLDSTKGSAFWKYCGENNLLDRSIFHYTENPSTLVGGSNPNANVAGEYWFHSKIACRAQTVLQDLKPVRIGHDFIKVMWKMTAVDDVQWMRLHEFGSFENKTKVFCIHSKRTSYQINYLAPGQTYDIEVFSRVVPFTLRRYVGLYGISTLPIAGVRNVFVTQQKTGGKLHWSVNQELFVDVFNVQVIVNHTSTDFDGSFEYNFTLWDGTYEFNGTIGSVHSFEITLWFHDEASPPAIYSYTLKGNKNDSKLDIIISIASVSVCLIIALILRYRYQRKKLKRKANRFLLARGNKKLDPDRSILEQCNNLSYDPKFEFPRNNISLLRVLGEGAFGQVWMASAHGIEWLRPRRKNKGSIVKKMFSRNNRKTIVAVKSLKASATENEYKDLANELKLLIHIGEHRNIVNLLGACTKDDDLLVILEFCSKGALLSYIRLRRDDFKPTWYRNEDEIVNFFLLTRIGVQIADGMSFLEEKKCVHRDLAARNILLTDDMTVKVADFGLARDTTGENYYHKKTEGMLPIKWMAPEAIIEQKYTSKSDVWSFGILLWEIFTLGSTPYPTIKNSDILHYIKSGERLESPKDCPEDIYKVMLDCWSHTTEARPNFLDEQSVFSKTTMASVYNLDYRKTGKSQTEASNKYTKEMPSYNIDKEEEEETNGDEDDGNGTLYLTLGGDDEKNIGEVNSSFNMDEQPYANQLELTTDDSYLILKKSDFTGNSVDTKGPADVQEDADESDLRLTTENTQFENTFEIQGEEKKRITWKDIEDGETSQREIENVTELEVKCVDKIATYANLQEDEGRLNTGSNKMGEFEIEMKTYGDVFCGPTNEPIKNQDDNAEQLEDTSSKEADGKIDHFVDNDAIENASQQQIKNLNVAETSLTDNEVKHIVEMHYHALDVDDIKERLRPAEIENEEQCNSKNEIKEDKENKVEANEESNTNHDVNDCHTKDKNTNGSDDKKTKVKTYVEGEVETNVEGEFETNVEGEVETNVEGEVETNVEGEVEKNVEGEVEKNVEGEVETNVEGEVEKNVEGKGEKNVEGEVEKNVEGEVETNVEGEVETNVERKDDTNVERKDDTNVERN